MTELPCDQPTADYAVFNRSVWAGGYARKQTPQLAGRSSNALLQRCAGDADCAAAFSVSLGYLGVLVFAVWLFVRMRREVPTSPAHSWMLGCCRMLYVACYMPGVRCIAGAPAERD
jgi:hypothetical protein